MKVPTIYFLDMVLEPRQNIIRNSFLEAGSQNSSKNNSKKEGLFRGRISFSLSFFAEFLAMLFVINAGTAF
ncbi:MAG: hypothetical protein A2Y62_12140 [Candidatus Fischerbacteria bacterium RBG_13_37_8]|uniref:Uncharacterized protein n=1 Tax=Candidatus Fischerbacteria bacterium RBG_13_37_8 TaxID=1817863 RepID=A0A1F5VDH0_9BACT|nr:MAG: hypothetical protein A2Y62_12140 [Candidatus Fischerbacteria bacterium RBG_13_37_8]